MNRMYTNQQSEPLFTGEIKKLNQYSKQQIELHIKL